MDQHRQVVITGIGTASPIGIGRDAFWDSLTQGRSGVGVVDWLDKSPLPVKIGGQVSHFEPKKYVKPRKSLKVMSHEVAMGFTAAALAVDDANLAAADIDPDRIGVLYGSELFYCDVLEMESVYRRCTESGEFDFSAWGSHAMSELYPLWMLRYLPNMVACHIGIAQDGRGPNNTINVGECSALLAMIEASEIIRRGAADIMICGGIGNRLNPTPMMYRKQSTLSHRNDAPEQACRPFDAERDGVVNGEGSGAIVMETLEHARNRGANVLALVRSSCSRFGDPAQPDSIGRSVEQCIVESLRQGGIGAEEISHVNADAGGAIDADASEAQAIQRQLGQVPVTAPKSYFGCLGAGSGVVELLASVLAIQHGLVPPTLNYSTPDPKCPVNVVREPLTTEQRHAIVLSRSTTGQSVAVLLSAP